MDNRLFYNETPIAVWKQILGADLHYHFGFFRAPGDDYQVALQDNIRNFYRWIPEGARFLDLGAGWGGPARLLREERRVRPLCVTSSDLQIGYMRETGLPVLQHDLETPLPFAAGEYWDVAMMMESLEHIRDKARLLADIRKVAGRLLLQVNCTTLDIDPSAPVFNGSMVMPKVDELLRLLADAGWRVRFSCNRRYHSFPSFIHWKLGLQKAYPDLAFPTLQLRALNGLCDDAIVRPAGWMAENPLMDIVAE